MESTEQAEIARAQRDPRAFAPLYDRYFPVIFRFVHRRAGDQEVTADLTQQTFLKALVALPRYRSRGLPLRAWLYRIALNELKMYWRKRREVVMELSYLEVKGLGEEMGVGEVDADMQRLASVLGSLAPEKARLIELRFMDGLSFAEVGQVLGIGEDAAKMRTHRVLQAMREQMGPRT